jgi:GT2 family glycosyltransferase
MADASVVIATRDRPEDLRRCLAALAGQRTSRSFELVVVDDGVRAPLTGSELAAFPGALLLRTGGLGPAAARNAGLRAAGGPVIVFTDDDTEPAPEWVEAACDFLDAHPGHVGVEGPVTSPPFDYLYSYSLENERPGAYWTCNVAYRRSALVAVGGFSQQFPFPHCEDRDLGFRVSAVGPIGFAEAMRIEHHPRRLTLRQLVGRARFAPSEIVLFTRHRSAFGRERMMPARLFPLFNVGLAWSVRLRREGFRLLRSPRRLARFAVAATCQTLVVAALSATARVQQRLT